MQIGLLGESGRTAICAAFPGSILFQIAPQDRELAVSIILGFLKGVQEDGDLEAAAMLEAALAEIGGGEYSPLETDQLGTEVFDIDVRVLSGSGDMELRGADVGTVIFLFDPIESDLAVDVLEGALASDVFCGARAERIRAFIKSIEANHPMSISRSIENHEASRETSGASFFIPSIFTQERFEPYQGYMDVP